MNKKILFALAGLLFLSACSSNGKYVARGASYKSLTYGEVTAREAVTIGGSNTGIGRYVGAAAAIEDATSRSFLGFVVRGVAGSIVGGAAEEVVTRQKGMLYSIETARGRSLEIASVVKDLEVGSCVLIANAGRQRVKVKAADQSKCANVATSKTVAAT